MNDNGSRCKITVGSAGFRIREPCPFSKRWYSQKFHGPGLRYEIGICIQTGLIVWVNGAFACDEWPDLKIALESLVYMFEGDERAVADLGYEGHPCYFDIPWRVIESEHQKARKSPGCARHECINRRFKVWRILAS